ncbi:MAG: heme exporter protein CcmD [Pseudomonadales bacterium]|nr:heme exporter protein CcmD [Pseudomonadales bacterium]
MQFNSLQELWFMGGHGSYVWSAFAITATVVLGLVLQPILKRRKVFADIKQRKQFEAQQ